MRPDRGQERDTGEPGRRAGVAPPSAEAAFPAPWPVSLTTERLLLRPVERADVAVMSRLWTDTEVRRYLGGPLAGQPLRARERGCVGAVGAFSVVLGVDGTVIGSLLVEPESRWDGRTEVSYQLLPEHWGHGYGREAVAAVVSWALDEVTPHRPEVVAVTQAANGRSRRLLEAIGMRPVDDFVEWGARQVMYSADRANMPPRHRHPYRWTYRHPSSGGGR